MKGNPPVFRLTAHVSDIRLDKFLSDEIEVLSRSKVKKCIEAESVRVDGKREKPSYVLKGGESIQIEIPDEEPSAVEGENIPLEIVHEDDELIVINKPPGLVVHPAAGNFTGTLVNALVYHFDRLSTVYGDTRPGIVHRLDKDTSGILVVAKSDRTHRLLAEQFSSHSVKKIYRGLVWGELEKDEGTIHRPIVRHPRNRKKFAVGEGGKEAVTRYRVLKRFEIVTLVELAPKTGRTHQLRVHMAFLNHPVFADGTYGGGKSRIRGFSPPKKRLLEKLYSSVPRQALHAVSLTLKHPGTGKSMVFEAPVPRDLQTAIDTLEKWDG